MGHGGIRVHSWSMGSFVCALEIVGFIWGHWVSSGALCGSLGSLWVVRYIMVCPGGRRVHLGSLAGAPSGSLSVAGLIWSALGVVGFILGRWINSACALGVVGFIWGRWAHSRAPWESLCSFSVVGYIRVRPAGRRGHSRSLGTFRYALHVVGFSRDLWVLWCAP